MRDIGGSSTSVTILDTSGQKVVCVRSHSALGREEFADLWEVYIRDCDGFLLVCTVTDPRSLATLQVCGLPYGRPIILQGLLPRILHAKDLPVVPIVVAVNKCDLDKSQWHLSDQQRALSLLHASFHDHSD